MPSTPLSPGPSAEVKALAQAIRQATESEIDELARTLLTTPDRDLFGTAEVRLRALAHQIAAQAVEQHLARKKTATRDRA
jgi:hypothetical protein